MNNNGSVGLYIDKDAAAAAEKQSKQIVAGLVGVIAVLVVGIMFSPITFVPNGHRGVVTVFGDVQDKILQPGLSIVSPISFVHNVNVQLQKVDLNSNATTKDLRNVQTTITVFYHLNPNYVNLLYQYIGAENEQKILVGVAQDTIKTITARYTAEELITKRDEIRFGVVSEFQNKVGGIARNTITIDDIFITQLTFSDGSDNKKPT